MLIFYLSLIETQKDQSKFTQLYKQYQYLMYHIAYQILYNEQDAEDMVHKAFLKIIDHLQEYEDVFSYKTKIGYASLFEISQLMNIIERKDILQFLSRK